MALKRGLEGEWIGQKGETYRIRIHEDNCFACEFTSSGRARTVLLHVDADSDVIWWGAEGSHSLDASAICCAADEITWRPRKTCFAESEFCWRRCLDHRLTDNAKVQPWQPSLRSDASVFVPIAKSSNTGGVSKVSTCFGTTLRAEACSFVPTANGGDVSTRAPSLRAEACSFTPSLRADAHPFVPSLRAEACPFVPISGPIQYSMNVTVDRVSLDVVN